jgi:hypothetical protein
MHKISRFISILFVSILVLLCLILLFVVVKSRIWFNDFNSRINEEYVVTEGIQTESTVEEKIEEYVLSEEQTDFVTFTPQEVGKIVYSSVQDMLGERNISISQIYINSQDSIWQICGSLQWSKLKSKNIWICVDVTKDNMQTAQLYITQLLVQGIDISKIYPSLLTKVNKGFAEALITVNENRFVGRKFENIELTTSELVVKGSVY